MLAAGAKAPVFTLEDLSGRKHALADILARGPAIVALYKASCPVCQMTLPYLERIGRGSLQVIAISQDDARGAARFQNNYGLTIPILLDREDENYPVSNGFGISHVPSLFLVEPDGVVSLASNGFVKRDLEFMGKRAGVETFAPDEQVPEWKAG
jgi:peroxiredoxin